MVVVDKDVKFFQFFFSMSQIMNISSINLSQNFVFLLYNSNISFSKYFINILALDGAMLVPISMPIFCLYNFELNLK